MTDAQWALMGPHCLGKSTDPGRTGGDARRFFEAVLWIARTGAPWRDLPEVFGNWNTVFKRFRHWVKADVFKRIFDAVSATPTWSSRWSTAASSRSTATDRAQKGDSRPGHRPLARRLDHQDRRPDRCARQPGGLRAPAGAALRDPGVAPLIEGVAFGGLIADKAFDVDWILDELDARGAEVVVSQRPRRPAAAHRPRHLQVAPPVLRQTQGVQAYRHAGLQDRRQFRSHDLCRSYSPELQVNLNRP